MALCAYLIDDFLEFGTGHPRHDTTKSLIVLPTLALVFIFENTDSSVLDGDSNRLSATWGPPGDYASGKSCTQAASDRKGYFRQTLK